MPIAGRLHLTIADATGERSLTVEGAIITAGRDDTCVLQIKDASVSRRHGRFEFVDGAWRYVDEGSQNGSFLNGLRLDASKPVAVRAGDRLRLGSCSVSVLDNGAEHRSEPAGKPERYTPTLAGARPQSPAPRGAPLRPPGMGPLAPASALKPPEPNDGLAMITVGRAIDNEIVLSDPYVSSHHVEAWLADGRLVVRDLGSLNGTFVNEQPFTEGLVAADAVLRIGTQAVLPARDLIARLMAAPQPSLYARQRTDLEHLLVGQSLGRVVGGGKVILRDVDIAVRQGQFVAIAGASGAGKSTLMKVLNGYTPPDHGRVLVARNPRGEEEIGYVPQDDIINRELPLREGLVLSALLRYPPGTARGAVEQRADEVLTQLGLSENAGTVVSRLSGGQRKRASVALELMTQPRLLLLDEPTSGLDPASDRRLIRLLRALADAGYGIVLITHTTANIAACDTVAFLAPGGYLVFWGGPEDAKRYFQTDDLESVYETLESESPQEWRGRFEQSQEYRQLQADVAPGVAALDQQGQSRAATPRRPQGALFWQLRGLSLRYFRTLLGDRRNLTLLLAQVPVILLLARLIFGSDVLTRPDRVPAALPPGVTAGSPAATAVVQLAGGHSTPGLQLLFVLATTLVWIGLINAAREICKESAIWEREQHVGVRAVPYVLSKIIVLGALCAAQTLILLVLLHLFWSVPGGVGSWMGILLTGFLAALSGVAIGLCVSASVATPDRAVTLLPIFILPQILFAGVIVPLSTIGQGKILSYVVGARWAFEAMSRLTQRALFVPDQSPYAEQISGSWATPVLALLLLTAIFTVIAALLVLRGEGGVRALLQRQRSARG